MKNEQVLSRDEYLKRLRGILKTYEEMDVNPPKGNLDFKTISEYDYLSKIKYYVRTRVPLMIKWLETGEIPALIFDASIKVSYLVNDINILKIEEEIIAAQEEGKFKSKIA